MAEGDQTTGNSLLPLDANNHYQILEEIHRGRHSVIYRAIDNKDNRRGILKIPSTEHPSFKVRTNIRHKYFSKIFSIDMQ
jgi:serine/threonine protein kinase